MPPVPPGTKPLGGVILWTVAFWLPILALGRIYGFGDRAKPNKASKRPLTQASLRCKR
jgi:hypothetical protein